jgi:hypothetical protein
MELAAIFTATPAEIDTELVAVRNKMQDLHWVIDGIINRQGLGGFTSNEEVKLADLNSKVKVLAFFIAALQAEYNRRGGWDRVYAVNNSNGHFHRSTACRNTFVTTQWVDMPELSGLTNAEVVERTGKMTCLTCFADQREEIEKGREATVFTPAQAKSREEQAAAAAQRAAKQAKAAANAITNPDGTPLYGRSSLDLIKTVRTAWIEAVSELEWAEISEHYIATAKANPGDLGDKLDSFIASNRTLIKEHCEVTFHIAQAIAVKEDRPLADVLTEVVAKADKKIRKNRKDR